jgi:hypothetical protein
VRVYAPYLCGAAIAIGAFARLWLWWRFIGSADAHIWAHHAGYILAHGLAGAYEAPAGYNMYNHPPVMGWLSALWSSLCGGRMLVFSRWLKLPGLIGDFAVIALLWRFGSPVAAAIYALSPVAILISGFHGNTDAFCAVFVLAGAIAADRERWFTAGALFAAGINVKLVPLLLLPILLLAAPRRALPRLAAGLALVVIPFIPPALEGAAAGMRSHLLGYIPVSDLWGVMAFLTPARGKPRLAALQAIGSWYAANGRFVVLAAIVVFAAWARFRNAPPIATRIAVGAALWLILTPGSGIHYLIYPVALLCLVNRSYAVLWSITAGAVLAVSYWNGLEIIAHPLTSWSNFMTSGPGVPLGIVAWVVLVLFVSRTVRISAHRYSPRPPASVS